jgi:predicted TIM-barrel fold metal-dependent hydrolase
VKVFDMFGSLPTPERVALEIRSWGNDPGYTKMFRERWARSLGLPTDVVEAVAALDGRHFLAKAASLLAPHLADTTELVAKLRSAGMDKVVVHGPLPTDVAYPTSATADLASAFPDLLVGFGRIDPTKGRTAVREVDRAIGQHGLRGFTVTPFWHGVACSDSSVRGVFAAAAEAQCPVWIHCSVFWRRDRPLSVEHPWHLEQLAIRFPELTLIAGHGGWPWVNDLVAVAWRHPNVYIDTSAFRPRHLFVPGSGWEALAYYGDRTIADKVLFGSTWSLLGRTPEEVIAEASAVPWSADTKHRWLWANAAQIFGSEDGIGSDN